MSSKFFLLYIVAVSPFFVCNVQAEELYGSYLESRSCDVYTGPCFANGEMGMAGKEALLAWNVEKGSRNGVSLEGLSVALVLKSDETLGDDGVFGMKAGNIKSVILVDQNADEKQHEQLIAMVKENAREYTKEIASVETTPMKFESNYDTRESLFEAGKLAKMQTRSLTKTDCICTNEMVYYQPLVDVMYATPAFSVSQSYNGKDLNAKWSINGSRSSFLAAFRK